MPPAPQPGVTAQRRWALQDWVVLLQGARVTVITFGLFVGLGAFVGIWLMIARQLQLGLAVERIELPLCLGLAVTVPLGARAYSLLLDWKALLQNPAEALTRAGFAFQGGLIGGCVAIGAVAASTGTSLLLLLDSLAFGLPLAHAIGRIGCLTYGCCHGRPTRSRLALRFHHPQSKVVWGSGLGGVPLHPTQLYSAAGSLLLFAVQVFLAAHTCAAGVPAATYLLLTAVGRFALERLRGVPAPSALGLTVFQWTALGTAAAGLWLASLAQPGEAPRLAILPAVAQAAHFVLYPALLSGALFVIYGVQGRRLGTWRQR